MKIFKVCPSYNYLELLADYIIKNYQARLTNLKVILPSGYLCFKLEQILVIKLKVTILPMITPISDLTFGGEDIFKMPSSELLCPSLLEEKAILASIIHSYPKLQFTFSQAVKFSQNLANFFYELDLQNIPLERINQISGLDQSEHWQVIYEFLSYAMIKWQNAIKQSNKIPRSELFKNTLTAELNRIKLGKYDLIVAGIIGDHPLIWQFLAEAAKSQYGVVILPPLDGIIKNTHLKDLELHHPLYSFNKFLNFAELNLDNIPNLVDINNDKNYLANLLVHNLSVPPQVKDTINYHEFDNFYFEAEAIAVECRNTLNDMPNAKLAIIINNLSSSQVIEIFLQKFNLNYASLIGKDLLLNNIYSFIYSLSKFLCSNFQLDLLIGILKHPYFFNANNSTFILTLEKLLIQKNRFITSFDALLTLVKQTENDMFITWIHDRLLPLKEVKLSLNFTETLQSIIKLAEHLVPNLWNKEDCAPVSSLFSEIIGLNLDQDINLSEFPDILKSLSSGARNYDSSDGRPIIICQPDDAALLKFDKIFLPNFNETIWPKELKISPWLSRQMEEELNFYPQKLRQSREFYNFYLMLYNPIIHISRSKKIDSTEYLPSSYLLKLEHALNFSNADFISHTSKTNSYLQNFYHSNHIKTPELTPQSNFFPSRISASDINLLVKSPFDFYAKKILKLKKAYFINQEAQAAELGTLLHKVIELYTCQASLLPTANKLELFLSIADELIQNSIFPLITQKLWRIKIQALAEEFIIFDTMLSSNAAYSYSEVRGNMPLEIHGHNLEVTAIADRIDLDSTGAATIIDYKTGIVPSVKDIKSGLASQLLLEALIVRYGKFTDIRSHKVNKILYVKIASSSPYIQTTEISLTEDDLENHLQGLKNLLSFYVQEKKFSTQINLLNYSDYIHLSRKFS